MITQIGLGIAGLLLLGAPMAAETPPVEVKVTQRHLEPACLDGVPVKHGQRSWRLDPGMHALAFTMRNEPRHGVGTRTSGVAEVSFALEAGHKYEVEVRASPMAFSSRVWERREWTPVVRDRTTDAVVSGEPQWADSGCAR